MNIHDATEIAYKNGYQQGQIDTAKKIFEELETVLFILSSPVINGDGTITSVNAEGLHLRLEDYFTIKNTYTEDSND